MTKASDLLVSALENEGVERIFAVPGEENLDVVESLRRSRIELIVTRHEQGAAFMAATHGRLTGRPGVCLSTLGPGALNFTTGAAYAHLGAMPMLLLTGQKPIKSARQGRFQIVDIVGAMRPLTKMTRQIVSAASIPTLVREAFRIATEERPGPVHLELPEDIAAEAAEAPLVPPHPIEWPVAASPTVERVASLILAAQCPLIMIGAAGNRPRLVEALSDFVRRARIPFFNTQMGKGAVTGSSDLYIGTAALSERDYVHEAIDEADLIVAIGHDTVEKPPFLAAAARDRKLIHVGYLPASVDQVFYPDAELVGDIGASVAALAARLEGRIRARRTLDALREKILSRVNERADDGRFPIAPQRLVRDVRGVVPEDGIVCLDNGMYKIWFARNYRTRIANTLLLDNALATMGAGLPSAIMAKLLNPGRRVLAVCGDGGFLMNSQELETAVRLRLDLVTLIIVDGAYGMIRWKQAVDRFPDFGMTFGNPDFVKYAESYGARGHQVRTADELAPTLEAAFAAGGIHLVATPIDYSENIRVFVDELASARAPGTPAGHDEAKIRVGILFGGQSAEHEISILSARNVLAALDPARFEPLLIGIAKDGRWLVQDAQRLLASARDPRLVRIDDGPPAQLPSTVGAPPPSAARSIDVVFPVLHGTLGEDGAVQGLLEVAGIPYVGAGILGSAIGMDKDVMKRLLRDAGIPVTEFRTVRRQAFDTDPEAACRELAALGFPLFVKPANAGSSVGISKVADAAGIDKALRHAFEFDSKALGEAAVDGREIELAILGGNPPIVSVAGEIIVKHPDGFYSYDAKYIDEHGVSFELPARLSAEEQARAQELAARTFQVLECAGLARVDLFLDSAGRFLVNEINTLPGFTAISMYPKLWALSGVPQQELVTRLIELALDRAGERAAIRRSIGC